MYPSSMASLDAMPPSILRRMTSRERLLAALRRRRVDRLPVTLYEFHPFGGCWAADEPSYRPLLDAQSRLGDAFVFAPVEASLFGDPNAVHSSAERAAGGGAGDERSVRTLETPRGTLTSVTRRDPGIVTTWTLKHFIETREDIDRFLSLPYEFPPPDIAALRELEAAVGERGVLVFSIGDPVGNVVGLCNFDFIVEIAAFDPGIMNAMLDRASRYLTDLTDALGAAFHDTCFRFWGPEFCGAPLMDPRTHFRGLVVDRVAPLVEKTHATGNLALLHCHGRLDAILEMIAETGCDALEPLEVLPVRAADVTMAEVRRRIGDRMCLAGGMQAVDLDTGTPDLVASRVRRIAEEAGTTGLIILPTSTPLQVPLPPAIVVNYEAMFEAAAVIRVG
jgi:uroporphyrinogen decarboxylase